MSIKVMTEVWKYSRATDPSTMLVEIALADHANEERSCFPGNKLLAAKCRMKARAVQRQIRKLENLGEIRVEPRLGHSNLYVIRDYEMTPAAQDTPVNLTPLSSTTPGGVAGDAPPLSSTTPITIKESSREPSFSFSEDFNAFWDAFPRKHGRSEAEKAFAKAIRDGAIAEEIIAAAERFRDDPNLPEATFIPQGKSWLSQKRWCDPPLPPRFNRSRPSGRPPLIDFTNLEGR